MHELIEPFVDYVTLVYHEARNVRHLTKGGFIEKKSYQKIISSLREKPEEAWRELQRVRNAAKKTLSVKKVEKIFRDRFGLGLEDLVVLFKNPNWRHAKLYGGNRWADITRSVVEFRDAIESNDLDEASNLQEYIKRMLHNTGGTVENKLCKLDAWLESN